MRRSLLCLSLFLLLISSAGCGASKEAEPAPEQAAGSSAPSVIVDAEDGGEKAAGEGAEKESAEDDRVAQLTIWIGEREVPAAWEDNESVAALSELAAEAPLTVELTMYGGFEQVGFLGESLPSNDVRMTTSAGDIVLYSGNQIVLFYGSNTWAYTRLGHMDLTQQELQELLGSGDVSVTLARQTGSGS